ncbi:MAG: class I SAM-dependent methyltransferase [Deltaproteobacteria bacterium]|nr:class I SAM-dependent methyltransferase [Deltaproteobacteria bacterium]
MLRSPILDGLGARRGTDKSSGPQGHDFLRKYEFFFQKWRDEEIVLLELGVLHGASLRAFADYFPRATVVGADIEEITLKEAQGRVKVIVGDIAQISFLEKLAALGPQIVIDDASHWWPDQLRSLFALYERLRSGGIYVVEDVHTSFEPLAPLFQAGMSFPPFAFLQKVAEYMTGNYGPSPIVRDKPLLPLSPAAEFHEEIKAVAQMTDAIVFIERAVILIKK